MNAWQNTAEMRRLSDFEAMQKFESNVVTWKAMDIDPEGRRGPTYYRFHYELRSIVSWKNSRPVYHTGFDVNLDLNSPYPQAKAKAKFVGQIPWHPNVHPDGRICYEDRWIAGIGIELDRICEIIGWMIAYQAYGLRHQNPVRTDETFWTQFNKSTTYFPTDTSRVRKNGVIPRGPDYSDIIVFGD